MQSVFHSPFLQALGYAIAGSLWQMAIVWMIFSVCNILLKPNATNKYRLAVVLQLTGFIWFIVTLQFYYQQCYHSLQLNNSFKNISNISFVVPEQGTNFQSTLLNWMIKGEQLLPFLSSAYLLLLIILLIRWISNYQHTQHIRSKNLLQIGIKWQEFIEKAASQLGIQQRVSIFLSEYITSPLTVGFIKPLILVPVASINNLTTYQLEAVLLHELAHIKRFDYLFNIILSVIETALFFNPFTQLISKSIKQERENSCDDYVLKFQYNPSMYAEALLQIAYLSKQAASPLSMNAVKKNGDLLSRIKRMIGSNNNNKFNYRNQLLSLLLITAILSSVAWLHPVANNKTIVQGIDKNKQQIFIEPMAVKINNPLFNPVFFLQKPLQQEVERKVRLITENNIELLSKESMKNVQETLQTVAPMAAKQIENIDFDKMNLDIQQAAAEVKLNNINFPKINIDTTAIKNSLQFVFNAKQWTNINADLIKAKAYIEQTANASKVEALNNDLNIEIQKANDEIKKLNIPFIGHLQIQTAEQEKQLNEKIKAFQIQQQKLSKEIYRVNTSIKRKQSDTLQLRINLRHNETVMNDSSFTKISMPVNYVLNNEPEDVSIASPAIYYPVAEEEPKKEMLPPSAKINSKNKLLIIRDKKTNKLIEIVIPVEKNGATANKIVIEINKD